MLQRHVEEEALHHSERAVGGRLHAAQGEGERLRVGGEGARAPAEHVARELIEQKDEAQEPPRAVGPARELSGRSAPVQRSEAGADLLIVPPAFLPEPEGRACGGRPRAEPELAHRACLVHQPDRLSSASKSFSSCCAASRVVARNLLSSSLTRYCAARVISSCSRKRRSVSRAAVVAVPSASSTLPAISRLEA